MLLDRTVNSTCEGRAAMRQYGAKCCALNCILLNLFASSGQKGKVDQNAKSNRAHQKSIMPSSTILTIAAALGCVLVCASAAPMTDAQVRGALGQAYARRSGLCLMRGSTRHG